MTSEEQYEQIERFLAQKMSLEERRLFQGKLEKDPSLQKAVQLHEELHSGLAGEQVHRLRGIISRIDEEWSAPAPKQPAKARWLNWRVIGSVAAVLAIAIIGYFSWEQALKAPPEDLFAQHFEPYQIDFALNARSDSENQNAKKIRIALDHYQKEEYALANQQFADLLAGAPDNVIFLFYTALTHLSLNQPTEAILHLQKLVDMPPSLFSQQSRWYLGLAYLQQGDAAAASRQLEKISSGDFKYEEARKILRQL